MSSGPAHTELAGGWAGEPSPEDSGKRAWKRGARPPRAPPSAPARPTWGRLQVISSRNWASGVEKLEKSEESEAGKAASRKSSLAGARILGTPGAHLQPATRCRAQPSGHAAPEGRANRPRAVPLARAPSPGQAPHPRPPRPPRPPAPRHPQRPPALVPARPVAPVTVVPATNQARRSWSRGRMAPPSGRRKSRHRAVRQCWLCLSFQGWGAGGAWRCLSRDSRLGVRRQRLLEPVWFGLGRGDSLLRLKGPARPPRTTSTRGLQVPACCAASHNALLPAPTRGCLGANGTPSGRPAVGRPVSAIAAAVCWGPGKCGSPRTAVPGLRGRLRLDALDRESAGDEAGA